MKLHLLVAIILSAAFLVVDASAAPQKSAAIKPTHADIAYASAKPAESKGNLLDLYLPLQADGPTPLVIWTSGSAWLADNGKVGAAVFAEKLLPAGYAVAGVSVRSSSQVTFPGQLHDIKASVRWLRLNAAKYNIDPDRIGIMGDSSGGWTAAMTAVTGDVPELEGDVGVSGVSSAVQAAISFYPPTNFLKMDTWALGACESDAKIGGIGNQILFCHDSENSPEALMIGCPTIQGCKAEVQRANPVNYISEADPPVMILHGRSDRLVPHNQGERLYQALNKACKESVFISLPLAGHGPPTAILEDTELQRGTTIQSTSTNECQFEPPSLYRPGWSTVIEFLNRYL